MANQQHLNIFKQGVISWNQWRQENPDIKPDLSEADLAGLDLHGANLASANLSESDLTAADLSESDLAEASLFMAIIVNTELSNSNLNDADLTLANLTAAKLINTQLLRAKFIGAKLLAAKLSGANLSATNFSDANLSKADLRRAELCEASLISVNLNKADLRRANLSGVNLSKASLKKADLSETDLRRANLSETDFTQASLFAANLTEANLSMANLSEANLAKANLQGANLYKATLVETNFMGADLSSCSVYGISTWNVQLESTIQSNLIITLANQPTITVDNLVVAQFIYLLLDNRNIGGFIDTITNKVALILGRFTPERKAILDDLREELRKYNYLPVLFDFEKPSSRDFTETVTTLAHLSRFIIADLTDPSSIPQELQAIVPNLEIPVQPLLEEGNKQYAMFKDLLQIYPWVLPVYLYKDQASLIASLKDEIIEPADKKARELAIEKAKRFERP